MRTIRRRALRLALGCAGLASLAACGRSQVADAPSTGYYLSHAAHDYSPPGPRSDPWGPYIRAASSRFDVPESWVRRVMQVESGGHEYMNGELTTSARGALGLMQLEPETYNEMAARYDLGSDPFNPYDNIMAGTAYIHEMYEVYGAPGFLAAYNAGPGRLDQFLNEGRHLPRETVAYVTMIAPAVEGRYPAHRSAADQLALNTLPLGVSTGLLPRNYDPGAAAIASLPQAPDPAPVEVAALTPPIIRTPFVAPETPLPLERTALVEPPAAPPALPVLRPRPHFSLVPDAMADTPPPRVQEAAYRVAPGHVGWAIQVGAYATAENARDAIGIAQLSATHDLRHGRAQVEAMHNAGRTKYRARITGLAHDDAQAACQRLSGGPTGCALLSPEAQS